jgi:hypothetical protein
MHYHVYGLSLLIFIDEIRCDFLTQMSVEGVVFLQLCYSLMEDIGFVLFQVLLLLGTDLSGKRKT